LNVIVPTPSALQVTAGFCSSMYDDTNLILQQDVAMQLLDLESDTWYAVYVGAADASISGNDAQVYVSTNFNELPLISTTRARRIGWIRTAFNSSNLLRLQQQGDGIRRSTFFLDPFPFFNFGPASAPLGIDEFITLADVPPTANSCTIQIELQFSSPPFPTDPLSMQLGNQIVTFSSEQEYQLVTVTVPLLSTFIPQRILLRTMFNGYAGAFRLTMSLLRFVDDL